ncbi:MAG: DUF4175 family protein [Parvularculaceae bacterium]
MTKALKRRVNVGERLAKRPPGPFTISLTRGVLLWEQLWPVLLAVGAPSFLILTLGLFDVWRIVPEWAHWLSLAAAIAATGAAALRFGPRLSFPPAVTPWRASKKTAALLIRAGDQGPALPLRRGLASSPSRRDAPRGGEARLRTPKATADAVDPWSLRFAAPGLLAVALAAGPQWASRLTASFTPGSGHIGATAVADLWIEPPAYTGKAPISLLRAGEAVSGGRQQIDAPAGSHIVAQINNARRFALSLETPEGRTLSEPEKDSPGRASLPETSGAVCASAPQGRWPIGVVPDTAPSVGFIEPPATTDDARLAVALSIDDDYGITGATLRLRLDPDQERPLDAPELDEMSVRETRSIALDGVSGKSGERRFDLDLQSDPWAGLGVIAKIVVTDGAGQTGETEEVATRLPAREFYNPLARAVIEQRQTLAVAAKAWPRVGRSLDALTFAPDRFYDKSTDYLLIRTAFWKVMRQRDEDFKQTVEEFWPLALQLEDEALELARRRLEAAQDALRQALENNASDDEIAKLVEELRDAMQQYLQALAQSGQIPQGESAQGDEALTPGDLDQMLDSINNLAQSGARSAARQALSDLENLLNNLRMSSRGAGGGQSGQGSPGQGQGGAAGEAGDLIGRQRDLSNRAFDEGKEFGANGDPLAGEQGDLAGDLSKLLDALKENGSRADPNGDGARSLGQALRDMQEAESALRSDNFDAATTAMEDAIGKLREGAQALAEAQGKQAGQQMGQGQTQGEGASLDPLGRPAGNAYGRGVDLPEEGEARSARDVLDELRRRLSDGERSEDEVKYLERLLDWF